MNKDNESSPEKEENSNLTLLNIGIQNRPFILNRMLESAQSAPQLVDHLFRLEFDVSTGIPATWVDTKTLNFLNSLRD